MRHACAAISLLFAASAVLADDLQEASKLLRSGQHQQALERINKILAAKPRDAQARFLKGLTLTEQGNAKEAIVIFQKLTEDFPDLPEPYNNLAVIYAAQGQYDKARASLEQSIRTHPSYATAYENLGDVYSKLASQAYDKALQLDSSNSAAQNKLALVRELVGGAPRGATNAAQAALAPKVPAKPAAIVTAQVEPKPVPASAPAAKPAAAEAKPVAAVANPVPMEKTAEKPAEKTAEKPAEKPAPKAAPKTTPNTTPNTTSSGGDDPLKLLSSWAEAWSQKNVDAYLAFYAKDFKTPKGEPRAEWEQGRRARITAPKAISVAAEAPKVTMKGDTQATVSFRQRYKSDTLDVNGMKTLVLVKTGAGWQIQQERVGN